MRRLSALAAAATLFATGAAAGIALADRGAGTGATTGGTTTGTTTTPTTEAPRPISQTQRRKAANAARRAVGGGSVTRVKRVDDGRVRWEVKVRKPGVRYEVRLTRSFRVVSKRREG